MATARVSTARISAATENDAQAMMMMVMTVTERRATLTVRARGRDTAAQCCDDNRGSKNERLEGHGGMLQG